MVKYHSAPPTPAGNLAPNSSHLGQHARHYLLWRKHLRSIVVLHLDTDAACLRVLPGRHGSRRNAQIPQSYCCGDRWLNRLRPKELSSTVEGWGSPTRNMSNAPEAKPGLPELEKIYMSLDRYQILPTRASVYPTMDIKLSAINKLMSDGRTSVQVPFPRQTHNYRPAHDNVSPAPSTFITHNSTICIITHYSTTKVNKPLAHQDNLETDQLWRWTTRMTPSCSISQNYSSGIFMTPIPHVVLNGTRFKSAMSSGEPQVRPISRFTSRTVFLKLLRAMLAALSPMNLCFPWKDTCSENEHTIRALLRAHRPKTQH